MSECVLRFWRSLGPRLDSDIWVMHLRLQGRDGDGVESKKSKVRWCSFSNDECMSMFTCMFVIEILFFLKSRATLCKTHFRSILPENRNHCMFVDAQDTLLLPRLFYHSWSLLCDYCWNSIITVYLWLLRLHYVHCLWAGWCYFCASYMHWLTMQRLDLVLVFVWMQYFTAETEIKHQTHIVEWFYLYI